MHTRHVFTIGSRLSYHQKFPFLLLVFKQERTWRYFDFKNFSTRLGFFPNWTFLHFIKCISAFVSILHFNIHHSLNWIEYSLVIHSWNYQQFLYRYLVLFFMKISIYKYSWNFIIVKVERKILYLFFYRIHWAQNLPKATTRRI